jgi:uncharacterized protein YdeI (YjbR/CyaY-like superfamily)
VTKNSADVPIIAFETQHDWHAWLDEHQAEPSGVWLKIAKKAAGIPTVTYADALESALCYGWIDGQKRAFDDRYFLQRFTPRRANSIWSRVNRDKAMALIAEGRMQPAGLQQVELAKGDGRWEAAYQSQRTMTIPDDLQRALDENPQAKEFFGTLNSSNRYAILWRVETAKKPETRAARIATYIEMLTKGEKIHP